MEKYNKNNVFNYKGFLFLFLFLCEGGGTYIINALIFRLLLRPVSQGLNIFTQVISLLASLVVLAVFLKMYFKEKQNRDLDLYSYLGVVSSIAYLCITFLASGLIYRGGMIAAVSAYTGNGVLAVIIAVLTIIILLFLMITMLFSVAESMLPRSLRVTAFSVWRHVGVLFATVAVLLLILPIHLFLNTICESLLVIFGPSFAARMISRILVALVYTCVFDRYLACVENRFYTCGSVDGGSFAMSKNAVYKKLIAPLLFVVLFAVSVIVAIVPGQKNSIIDDIEKQLDEADLLINKGSMSEGIRRYMKASDMVSALDAFVSEDDGSLKKISGKHPGDLYYTKLMYALTGDIDLIRERIIRNDVDFEMVHIYLNAYAAQETDGEEEHDVLVRELSDLCIAEDKLVSRDDITGKNFLKKSDARAFISEQSDRLSYGELFSEVIDIARSGNVSEDQVETLLDMAQQHPESMIYQLAAVSFSSEAVSDNSGFLKEFSETVLRMDKLYNEGDPLQEALINEKLYAAELLLKCYDYEDARNILEDIALIGNESVENELMFCMNAVNDYRALFEYADSIMENGERAEVLYYLAISTLKMKDYDKSLDYAIKLSGLIEKEDSSDIEHDSKFLYNYAQYICINDTWRGIVDYNYSFELTDEQLQKVNSTQILKGFVGAVTDIFVNRDYEGAVKRATELESIYPNMSMLSYIKGTAYMSDNNMENAKKEFLSCLQRDPENMAAAYSLALVHDALEEYDEANALCDRILVSLPEQDHGTDWYGIAIHVKNLKNDLKQYSEE